MFDTLCEISISDIDLNDDRYKISFGAEDVTFLARSIKEIGLITPPVVRLKKDNKYTIISGFNRIGALFFNNETKVPVYQIDKKTDDCHCLLLAITSVAFKRPLTHVETIISIKRLSEFLEIQEMAKKSPAVFNIQLSQSFIQDLLNIGSLPEKSLELIQTGNLSLKSAKKIACLDENSISFFLDIFSNIKASVSVQLEIIQNILEISAREGVHPDAIFNDMKTRNPLYDENSDIIVKTDQFRTMVFDQRYPVLSKTRQTIKDKIVSIKFPGTLKLIPPENFESRNYSIFFKLKSYDDLRNNIDYLTAALENKTLQEVLNS
jgi:ParB family transcriptional regulator, chromosome partitioning protein